MFHKFILSCFTFFILLFAFSINVYAANYGDGAYGCGNYGEGGCSGSSSSNNSSSSNTSGGGSTSSSCGNQAPSSPPNLFQINAKNTSAILYFSPAGQPYSNYFISYGNGIFDEGYGVSFDKSNSNGSIIYTVSALKPNTTYSFKVRAGNGCAAGGWSNTLRIKTTASSKSTVKYYPKKQASSLTFNTLQGILPTVKSKLFGGAKATTNSETTSITQKRTQNVRITANAPKHVTPTPQKSTSLWDKVLDIFR